jgi:NAD dependent epimerase/dehydratase family enzyme
MHRASWVPVPKFALRLLLGEAADEMLLSSQKVVPTHLVASGFQFDDPKIDRAIARALLEADRKVT